MSLSIPYEPEIEFNTFQILEAVLQLARLKIFCNSLLTSITTGGTKTYRLLNQGKLGPHPSYFHYGSYWPERAVGCQYQMLHSIWQPQGY